MRSRPISMSPARRGDAFYGVAVTVRVTIPAVVIELVPTTMLVPLIAKFAACEPLSVSAPDQFEGLTAQLATWVPAATGTVNGPPAVQLILVEAGLLKMTDTVVLAAKADTGARNSATVARKRAMKAPASEIRGGRDPQRFAAVCHVVVPWVRRSAEPL